MRAEHTGHDDDDEPTAPATEDGTARTYRLAFVCVLGLMVGGAAALALDYGREGAAEVRGVAAERPDAVRAAGAEAAGEEGSAAEDVTSVGEETVGEKTVDEGTLAADVAADEVEEGAAVSPELARRRRGAVRLRAESSGRAVAEARVTRRYARAPGRQVAAGGRGVGGHALGGVKKTGEGVKRTGVAIGRTVGKLGGLFHD